MSDPPNMTPADDLPPQNSGGSRRLGILLGIGFVAGVVALNILTPALQASGGMLLLIPLVLFLVAAIVLSAIPRTSSIGAGLLISLGISLLVSAGLCVALLVGLRQ